MAINPTPKETPTGDGNPTAGEAIKPREFPTAHTPDKAFQSMRTAYALRGHELHRTDPADGPVTYWTERWGLVRELPTLHDAARFLAQIGGRL
jgi:hypothetical protein